MRPRNSLLHSLLLVMFLLVAASSRFANGQVVGGTITGVVRDSSGGAVSGATVVVHQTETGATRTLSTVADGRFAAPSIPIGDYIVSVSHAGFSAEERNAISLTVGQNLQLDFVLTVSALHERVVVSAASPGINTTTQETSGLIDERQVKTLPLNGRSYDELLTLNPATVNYTAERAGGIGTSNSSVGNMFSVEGRRPQDNLFLLNGIEYTGASLINVTPGGASGELLGVDAVREFNAVNGAYGAAYGKRDGAQISIVTMSGTNRVHGTAYEFLRNSALDARNYFDQGTIPEFQRNQFGAALGGPLRRNKLFLFGNYEGFRQNWALSDVSLVPDDASRAQAAPSVQPLLALWPEANGPELGSGIAEAFSHPEQCIREDFGTTRLDFNPRTNDQLFAVDTVDDSAAGTPTQNPLSRVDEGLREQVVSVQEQHVFSPTLLNVARFGYSRAAYDFTGSTPADLPGWVTGKPIGAVVISGSTASNGASQITQAGTNVGSNNATARNLFTYADHVYWSRGHHQIEAGVWFQRIQSNDMLAQDQYGQASFSTLNSFLAGTVKTFTVVPSPTELGWRSIEASAFAQDTWNPTHRLEIEAGFRSESTNGWNEAHGRAANYAIVDGVLQTKPRVGNSALTKNRAVLLPEPRLGLAWNVRGNGKTAVRAGAGLYHGLLDTLDYRLDQTAPFNTAESIGNIAVADLRITPGTQPPAGVLVSPSNVQPDIATPAVVKWNVRLEQELAPRTSLTLGYVAWHAYHQILSEDMNEPAPQYLPNGTPYYPAGTRNANPELANSTSWVSQGVGLYNALEVDVRRQFTQGLQFRGNYTWSKNLDDGSAWNTSVSGNTPAYVEFPLRPKRDWGPAATDVRNAAAMSVVYELPFGRNRRFLQQAPEPLEFLTGGWTASTIVSAQSGFPFSPQLGYNPAGNGDTRNPVRPDRNPDFRGKLYPGTASEYFNPEAFLPPAAGTYGNVSRDSLTGPGLTEVDLSAAKTTRIAEGLRLEFRAEFFNMLNHTNFLTPNEVVYTSATSGISPTAGLVTATSTPSRQVQFGAKLQF
ncbi:MAG TPA: carboxypeptidase-like regulatory domain-containing protein [Acidobacteriaceae bacterium]|jgi:hypothetical protein|nr:carboxypeptidase-like regulatory domain-containing protein [Acidobacteriaceae bacterium]